MYCKCGNEIDDRSVRVLHGVEVCSYCYWSAMRGRREAWLDIKDRLVFGKEEIREDSASLLFNRVSASTERTE